MYHYTCLSNTRTCSNDLKLYYFSRTLQNICRICTSILDLSRFPRKVKTILSIAVFRHYLFQFRASNVVHGPFWLTDSLNNFKRNRDIESNISFVKLNLPVTSILDERRPLIWVSGNPALLAGNGCLDWDLAIALRHTGSFDKKFPIYRALSPDILIPSSLSVPHQCLLQTVAIY